MQSAKRMDRAKRCVLHRAAAPQKALRGHARTQSPGAPAQTESGRACIFERRNRAAVVT